MLLLEIQKNSQLGNRVDKWEKPDIQTHGKTQSALCAGSKIPASELALQHQGSNPWLEDLARIMQTVVQTTVWGRLTKTNEKTTWTQENNTRLLIIPGTS